MQRWPLTAWLRPALTTLGLAGLLILGACGGGSGAPNNPYEPPPAVPTPPTILPSTLTVYSGVPSSVTISGGTPPYRAFSSNTAILPVAQTVASDTVILLAGKVDADTPVTITVQDAAGATATSAITVKAAPLFDGTTSTFTFTGTDCGVEGAICSGQNGSASVRVLGPGGGPLAGRQIRFDVVQGDYAIVSTNPGSPLVQTFTVVSDANGNATVQVRAGVNAFSQVATIRATDVTSGNSVTGNFIIQESVNGDAVLSILPAGTTTINGPTNTTCSSGVRVTYSIFGGSPPYTISVNFPTAVTLQGNPVLTNGGSFSIITNGTCFEGLRFTIRDATGRTITDTARLPQVDNVLGTIAPPPPPTLVVSPSAVTIDCSAPGGGSVNIAVAGGTPPYRAIASQTGVTIATAGNVISASGIDAPGTTISVYDSGAAQQLQPVDVTCS